MVSKKKKSILIVHPTLEWTVSERLLFRDAMSYIDSGASVYAVVVKDSFLHKRLVAIGVTPIFQKSSVIHWWNWTHFKFLEQEIKSKEINVVQSVGQTAIWPLAHLLRNYKGISFVVTFPPGAKLVSHWADSIFYKRIDRYLVTSPHEKGVLDSLSHVSKRRIEYLPLGPFWNPTNHKKQRGDFSDGQITLGTYLPAHLDSIDSITPHLYAMRTLTTQNKRILLKIFSLKDWKMNVIHQELQNLLWELEISESVKLHMREMKDARFFDDIDIWISPHLDEFDDVIIPAISSGVPAISPRCETVISLIDRPVKVVKSCKRGDARDLRVQISAMIEEYDEYVLGVTHFCGKMKGFLVYDDYKKILSDLLDVLIESRARHFH